MVILDTNVLIDAMSGRKKAMDLIKAHGSEQLAITILNKYELLKGSKFVKKSVIEEFIRTMRVYDLENKGIEASSDIYISLQDKGLRIDELDVLIAGIAISNDEHLVTFDKHFDKINSDRILVI